MSPTRRATVPLAVLVIAACARMGTPPGGPPDFTPPRLLGTVPESVAVLPGFDDWVEFRFDEVINEGGQPNFGFGSGGLERLVMISPDSGVPRVRWRRDRIAVRPRDGWRPNTVYRVELGAGVADLAPRPNTRDSAAVITFTTGAPHPTRWLEGSAVDWSQQRFAPRALIEATLLDDSLVYRTIADSAGRFRLGPLPDGEFLVTAVLDANTNRRRDGREGWDSVRAAAGLVTVGEIWAFPRDTVPPRIEQNGISRVGSDSFAIAITLSQPVHPDLRLGPEAVTILRLPDSTALPAASAFPAVIHDSIYAPIDSARRAAAARAAFVRDSIAADSARAARDTAGVPRDTSGVLRPDTLARAPRPVDRDQPARAPLAGGRGTPTDSTDLENRPTQRRSAISPRLLIRTNGPLEPGQRYLIEVRGVRALSGTIADTLRGQLDIPEARRP